MKANLINGFGNISIPAYIKNKRGFTLIELLVVIAIIALLLSILTPALNQVKDRARRIMCRNRLHQWGIAIHAYAAGNSDKLMVNETLGDPSIPGNSWTRVGWISMEYLETDDGGQVIWNIPSINPYIDAFSKNFMEDGLCTPMVTCPAASGDFMQEFIHEQWVQDVGEARMAYAYWAGSELIDPANCSDYAKRDLTLYLPSPRRLLMSELLGVDRDELAPNDADNLSYNHGRTGWSWGWPWFYPVPAGHNIKNPNQQATGRSQLFGDGRVEWRAIPLETGKNLPVSEGGERAYCKERWNGPGSGWVNPYDTSFY
ncbi:MAG: type II secretion system protein [Planctomycetota bacterium]